MTKKLSDQNMSYREELINSIERNYIFSKKPINRFKIKKTENSNRNFDKNNRIIELKKLIDSIQNCNLKKNAKKEQPRTQQGMVTNIATAVVENFP